MPNELTLIKEQLEHYHVALDLRQHGGIAAANFVQNVEKILNRPWQQGAALNRSSGVNNADPRGAGEAKASQVLKGNRQLPVQPGADGSRADNA